jgi:hypothetical protein
VNRDEYNLTQLEAVQLLISIQQSGGSLHSVMLRWDTCELPREHWRYDVSWREKT